MDKKQKDEIIAVIEEYIAANGPRVQQIIAESHARNREEASRAEQQAKILRDKELYGDQPEPVDTRPRVVATKTFVHHGNQVPIGSIWLKSHAVVASAPSAFADVQD